MLITELAYNSDSDSDSISNKNKKKLEDINNDDAWDTDLEDGTFVFYFKLNKQKLCKFH